LSFKNWPSWTKNLTALLFGLCLAFFLLEIFLRIYNPFPFRLKGDRIILPASESYIIPNTIFPELDDTIIHHKNSLGFRGPELSGEDEVKIICVGGSTTECCYLSNGDDWPALVSNKLASQGQDVWLNNAGYNGHSSYGHLILVEDALIQLQPDYLIFLVGLNDMFRRDLHRLEKLFLKSETPAVKNWLRDNSEVFSLVANFRRLNRAKQFGLWHNSHGLPDAPTMEIDSVKAQEIYDEEQALLESYKNRLVRIAELCQENDIQPIFITQPHLSGSGIDPVTGADLKLVQVDDYNGLVTWTTLEMYNDVTRDFCETENIACIELARKLEKSTENFYDFTHYTKVGAEKVAEIVSADLLEILNTDARNPGQ
jgi:lysophospholipase L1-like esterase